MLPEGIVITKDTTQAQPGKTWQIDFDNNKVTYNIDDLDAIKQMIHLTLITEYQYSDIYNEFGLKVADLIGQDFYFIISELKRRICEALLKDSRISEVKDFSFKEQEDSVLIDFTVVSSSGALAITEEVSI